MALKFTHDPVGQFMKRNTVLNYNNAYSGDIYLFELYPTGSTLYLTLNYFFIQAEDTFRDLYRWDLTSNMWEPIDQKIIKISNFTGFMYTTLNIFSHLESQNDPLFLAPTGQPSLHTGSSNLFIGASNNPHNPFNSGNIKPNPFINNSDSGNLSINTKPTYSYDVVEKAFKRYGNKDLTDSIILELKKLDIRPSCIDKEVCETRLKELLSPETAKKIISYLIDLQKGVSLKI